ncbi:CbiX/SirB N-terminal domain-containing protein [Nocardioides convexus]|uniref:sirohydrochlorin chelatase n=1 Tax=Nocardioides convexus TaxID=2712224 RepID=UPI0024188F37|nr:CbiX/SirB N-terminal domain-containing protein [Nocardioides convexus]
MTAPALIALAHGSRDPRSAATITALVDATKALRPDLRIERAFLDLSKPGFHTVVDRLVKAGFEEIVVVPLLLVEAFHAKVDIPETHRRGDDPPPRSADPRDRGARPGGALPGGARRAPARGAARRPGP